MNKDYEQLPAEPAKYCLDVIWRGYVDNKIPLRTLREAVAENQKEIRDIESEKIRFDFKKFNLK